MLDGIRYIFKRIRLSKMSGRGIEYILVVIGAVIATAHIIRTLVPTTSYHPIHQTPGTAPDKYHSDILKLEGFTLFPQEARSLES